MTIKHLIIGGAVVAVGTIMFVLAGGNAPAVGGAYNNNYFATVSTNTAVTAATSSTSILAKNASRTYARITNTDANFVCLSLAAATAVDCEGIYLAASGGTYEITPDNLYIGEIRAISNTASSVLTVTEAVK